MSPVGPFLFCLPAMKPTGAAVVRLPKELEVVDDSDAFTPYMSQIVPGCPPCAYTAIDGSVPMATVMSWSPRACQPLCAPKRPGAVAPIESAKPTQNRSSPRRSSQSRKSMHAGAEASRSFAAQRPSFQRSGRTLNSCHRCPSVLPSEPWITWLVSGPISKIDVAARSQRRKKYSTCEPGVSRPSGMIFLYSLVVPDAPPYGAGTVPSQMMFVEFVAPFGTTMKQRFRAGLNVLLLKRS